MKSTLNAKAKGRGILPLLSIIKGIYKVFNIGFIVGILVCLGAWIAVENCSGNDLSGNVQNKIATLDPAKGINGTLANYFEVANQTIKLSNTISVELKATNKHERYVSIMGDPIKICFTDNSGQVLGQPIKMEYDSSFDDEFHEAIETGKGSVVASFDIGSLAPYLNNTEPLHFFLTSSIDF